MSGRETEREREYALADTSALARGCVAGTAHAADSGDAGLFGRANRIQHNGLGRVIHHVVKN